MDPIETVDAAPARPSRRGPRIRAWTVVAASVIAGLTVGSTAGATAPTSPEPRDECTVVIRRPLKNMALYDLTDSCTSKTWSFPGTVRNGISAIELATTVTGTLRTRLYRTVGPLVCERANRRSVCTQVIRVQGEGTAGGTIEVTVGPKRDSGRRRAVIVVRVGVEV